MHFRHQPLPVAPSRERLLADEVIYLHSLWRQFHPPCKRQRIEGPNERDSGIEWPLDSPPPPSTSWPEKSAAVAPRPPPSPTVASRAAASRAHRPGVAAAEGFFSKHGSDSNGSDEEEEEGEGEGEEEALEFFLGLFERDTALREYYVRRWGAGEFQCLACVGRKERRGKARRYGDCVGLVQHARAARRFGRQAGHRALAKAICRVLGWDMERLPSIVLDARAPLGQEHVKANAEEAKEDLEVGEKNSSGDGEQEGVHKEGISKEAIEKAGIVEIDPLSCEDNSKSEEFSKEAVEEGGNVAANKAEFAENVDASSFYVGDLRNNASEWEHRDLYIHRSELRHVSENSRTCNATL